MYCKKCNRIIPDDASYCPFCSTRVFEQPSAVVMHKKKNTGLVVALVVGILVFISIIAVIFGIFFSGIKKIKDNADNEEPVTHIVSDSSTDAEKNDSYEEKTTDREDNYYIYPVSFDQKEANIYVSNITEAGVPEFKGALSDDEILRFSLNHSILNYNPSVSGIEYGEFILNDKKYDVRIDNSYVSRLALRFFGSDKTVTLMNTEAADSEHFYGNSYGVSSRGVAFVEDIYCNAENDEYKIRFRVCVSDADDESVYYSYTPSQAEFDNSLSYGYEGYVIVQKCRLYGDEAYKIVEFKKIV